MTKMNHKMLQEVRKSFTNTPQIIFDHLIYSLILNNQAAYDIAVTSLNGFYNYTSIHALERNEYFFNTGFNKENITKHFTKFPLRLGKPIENSTLLNNAIRHGANDFVEYLLSIGVDPNVRDIGKDFPITVGVVYNNLQIVKSLIKYKADVNLPRTQKLSLLGISISLNSNDMVYELKHAGAIGIDKLYNTKPRQVKVSYPKDSIQYKNLLIKISAFQAIFSESNQDIFSKIACSHFERIDADSLSDLQDQKQINTVNDIIETLLKVVKVYQFSIETKNSLVDKIINVAKKYSLQDIIMCVYTMLGNDIIHLDSTQAMEYHQKAYDIAFNAEPGIIKSSALNKGINSYNLARAMRNFNPKYALTLYEQAEEYLPNDQDVIDNKTQLLLCLEDARGIDLISKCSDQEQMRKVSIFADSIEEIVPISRRNILPEPAETGTEEACNDPLSPSLENDSDILSLMMKARANKVIDEAEVRQLFADYANDNSKDITEMTDMLNQLLQGVYISLGLYKRGLELIEFLAEQYPNVFKNHKYIPLQYAEFIIYEANNIDEKGDKILEDFKKIYGISDSMHYQYSLMLKSRIENILFEQGKIEAQKFIDKIEDQHLKQEVSKKNAGAENNCTDESEAEPNPEQNIEQASSIEEVYVGVSTEINLKIDSSITTSTSEEALSKDLESKEIESSHSSDMSLLVDEPSLKTEDDYTATTSAAEAVMDTTLSAVEISYPEPTEVHRYYLKKKALPPVASTPPAKYGSSWIIGNKYYYTYQEDIVPIGINMYGHIDNKIYDNLDNKLQIQFTQSLKKGIIIGSSSGRTGVIRIKNIPIVKIKIDGDIRLYTDKVFINEENKELYIFDRLGNHKKLDKVTKSSEIRTEFVKGYTCVHEDDIVPDIVPHHELTSIVGSTADHILE